MTHRKNLNTIVSGQRHSFSLVEIILALAILAAGMMAVLRLFPLGLETTKDTVAEYNTAHSADTLLHLFQLRMHSDWQMGLDLPAEKKSDVEPSPSEWQMWTQQGNATYYHHPEGYHCLKVVQRTSGAGTEDFAAIYRLWRKAVTYTVYDAEETPAYREESIPTDEALTINLEISWPASAPYHNRDTALYSLDIFNQ